MGDLVQFELNEPVEVALKFAEPKMIETQYGERAMYSLADDRVMFHDTLTAAKIRALGVQPGDCFLITKRKKGRLIEYDVFRDAVEPSEPRKPIRIEISDAVAQALQEPIASGNRTKKLPPAPDLSKSIDPRKFAIPPVGWSKTECMDVVCVCGCCRRCRRRAAGQYGQGRRRGFTPAKREQRQAQAANKRERRAAFRRLLSGQLVDIPPLLVA